MEVLYIPQLDEVAATGETAATRYRIYARTPEEGTVILADKAVNKVTVTSPAALRAVFPPLVKGQVRDLFLRLVVLADQPPELTFAAPAGEVLSFEDTRGADLTCAVGVNVFAFTETDEGVFIVNRKNVDVEHVVEFDACGGTPEPEPLRLTLGGRFSGLPSPEREGYEFVGWYTEASGGSLISNGDTVKTGISKLYARWEVFEDPYAPVICPKGNLSFRSSGNRPWTVDEANARSSPGCARSGAISDGQQSSISTTTRGAGVLAFFCRVSSEANYDKLTLAVDGTEYLSWSGTKSWARFTVDMPAGTHTVTWKYTKDASQSAGSDCAWIDDVEWKPSGG